MNNYRKQKINEAISKSLFIGEKIKGRVKYTIVSGNVVYEDK